MKLSEYTKDFTPKEMIGDITELENIGVDVEIGEREYTKKDGDVFIVDFITVDGKEYRIPKSVIAQLKIHLVENPEIKNFKVIKKGKGLNTEYTVIPI